jgi:hypothetical protein
MPALLAGLDSKAVRSAKRGTAEGSLFVSLAILTKWFSLTRPEASEFRAQTSEFKGRSAKRYDHV